jgi:hypothetical protein
MLKSSDEQVVIETQEIHEEHIIARFDFLKRLRVP